MDLNEILAHSFILYFPAELRNESNIFSVDRGINQKRTENCINARGALLQKFSVFFSVDTSIIRKNIRFISYHLIFIASQDSKHSYKPIINDGLF